MMERLVEALLAKEELLREEIDELLGTKPVTSDAITTGPVEGERGA